MVSKLKKKREGSGFPAKSGGAPKRKGGERRSLDKKKHEQRSAEGVEGGQTRKSGSHGIYHVNRKSSKLRLNIRCRGLGK